ncbi:leucine-rich repeat domain-containing protein [Simiduia curdlanivorans]|uniref:Leucine-rich repeat domain-containing protein n=1 Tax=Simiduia curdlanivorans TaxID=1492769 RepID=A0ABV8V2C9_9GAMM|nr:leucine-rich repeat domain-containing protein [Simiduia curdlanivorans]MDN3637596.1 leucine-rich repeat domain-containing protein [Simiduia curdlanivorans]
MQKSSAYVFIATAAAVFALGKCASGPAPSQQVAESEATLRYAEIKAARDANRLNSAELEASIQHLDQLGLTDQALYRCVRESVEYALAHTGGKVITQPTDIEQLDCAGRGIFRLNGLEHFKKLTNIDLSGNKITSLEPLSQLHDVEKLDIESNQVTSIWSILGMDKLTTLKLTGNPVGDLNHVNGFNSLDTLKFKLSNKDRCDYLVSIKEALTYSKASLAIPSRCVDEFGEPARLSDFE